MTPEILLIGALSGMLTIFLNYTIGKPSSEFSPYEIFSFYTVWLAIRRLKKVGLYGEYYKQYKEQPPTSRKYVLIERKNDFKKMLYNAAEPFFTWERAVGMCPVCTGFWIALFTGLVFTQNFLALVVIIVISHTVIRILNKVL